MKKHTKIFLQSRGYDMSDTPMCECCLSAPAVDVHHIHPRGLGGSKTKDTSENLIGLCRECHLQAESKKLSKEFLFGLVNRIIHR